MGAVHRAVKQSRQKTLRVFELKTEKSLHSVTFGSTVSTAYRCGSKVECVCTYVCKRTKADTRVVACAFVCIWTPGCRGDGVVVVVAVVAL